MVFCHNQERINMICRNFVWLFLALSILVENLGSSVEHLYVVPLICLDGVTLMLLVTRNSVSCLGFGCFVARIRRHIFEAGHPRASVLAGARGLDGRGAG